MEADAWAALGDCGARKNEGADWVGDAGDARRRSSTMRSSSSMSSVASCCPSSMEHRILVAAMLLCLSQAASLGSREMLAEGVRAMGELSGAPRWWGVKGEDMD